MKIHIAPLPSHVQSILAAALILRLLVLCGGVSDTSSRLLEPDSKDYVSLAANLTDTGRYERDGAPEVFRAPGYPAFLAALRVATDSPIFPCAVQIIFDVAACFLVWRIARARYPHGATAALLLQAFSAVSVVYATKVLSDSIYAFFVVLLIAVLADMDDAQRERGYPAAVAAGLVIAIMTYLRAITLIYLYLPLAYLVARKRFREAGVTVAIVILCVAPWYIRNSRVADYPHFSTVASINLYRYNACLLLARNNAVSFQQQQRAIDGELGRFHSDVDAAAFARNAGRDAIAGQPLRYVLLHLKADVNNMLPAAGELVKMFGLRIGGNDTLSVLHSHGLIAGVRTYVHGNWSIFILLLPATALLFVSYGLAATGCVSLIWQRRMGLFEIFLVLSLAYFLLVPGGASHPRFRVPAAPFIALLAGIGWQWLSDKQYRFRRKIGPLTPTTAEVALDE